MRHGERRGQDEVLRFFAAAHGELHRQLNNNLTATLAALSRNRAARNRHQAARARHDMRTWAVDRRKRTRHLIELGGLVVKAGVVELTNDDRAMIYGALIWMAETLRSEDGERARELLAEALRKARQDRFR
jgi:hypothetical protein